MSSFSDQSSHFESRNVNTKRLMMNRGSVVSNPQASTSHGTSLGNQNGGSGMSWVDSSNAPKINTFPFSVQGNVYYLPDGGDIQFFLQDKPMEFYGAHACLVRNRHVPGYYVIRVPAGTTIYRISDFKELFEGRQKIAIRNANYVAGGPYIHEREVGINCGMLEPASATSSRIFGQSAPPHPTSYTPSENGSHGGKSGYYYMPAVTPAQPQFAVYPDLMHRVQTYIDGAVSMVNSSTHGSDFNAGGSAASSSMCPGSANELYNHRHGGHENGHSEFGYRTCYGEGYDMRANSGGYGRMFPSTNAAQNGHHYAQQSYENGGDSTLNGGHGQHGSYIPAIPAMAALVANGAPASLPPRHLNKKTNALYKTEMCRNWNEIGECRYGRSCQFAHGKKELRTVPRHGQWKTKTCMAWLHGGCTYGSRCCYAHEIIDHEGHPNSPHPTEFGPCTNFGDVGGSKFSEFFASRWYVRVASASTPQRTDVGYLRSWA